MARHGRSADRTAGPAVGRASRPAAAGLDLGVVGWILLFAGAAGLVFFLHFSHRRRAPRAVVTERRSNDDTGQPPA